MRTVRPMKIPKKRTQKRHKHTTYHGDRKIKVSPICVNAFMLWIRPLWSRVSGNPFFYLACCMEHRRGAPLGQNLTPKKASVPRTPPQVPPPATHAHCSTNHPFVGVCYCAGSAPSPSAPRSHTPRSPSLPSRSAPVPVPILNPSPHPHPPAIPWRLSPPGWHAADPPGPASTASGRLPSASAAAGT